jgi:hypothetical protein
VRHQAACFYDMEAQAPRNITTGGGLHNV